VEAQVGSLEGTPGMRIAVRLLNSNYMEDVDRPAQNSGRLTIREAARTLSELPALV
jgi:hypothetical protein